MLIGEGIGEGLRVLNKPQCYFTPSDVRSVHRSFTHQYISVALLEAESREHIEKYSKRKLQVQAE